MTSWEHQVHSPNGHFWSLPVLLRAAARGKPSGCDDELNTDNEQELLQRGRASKEKIREISKEINTDNEQDLLGRKDFRPSAREVRQPEQKLWQSRGRFENGGPSESLGELVHFAEGLCRDHIAVGRSHDRLGSVLTSRAASEPSASGETSAEDSVDDLEESAEGSIRGPSNHGGFQVDTTINQQALASGGANSHVDGVDTEQVSPSDTWVDEPEQVAFSNSVGQSEIPAISPVEEATRSNMEVQVCLDSFRSETVSEISGELDLCCLRRADCRFTQPGGPWFCGMQGASHTDFEWQDTLEVCGRERLCLRQISEAVDDSLHALWHGSPAPATRERERASDAIPALLANLSGQLRIYHFQLKEKRCVECMDGSVVLLELLSRLVEVLDALAPAESTGAAPAAVPCFRELVCDALNEALGLRGFLPLCISYVKGSPLEELDGSDLTLEMSLHALMAIQLCLLWFPPTRVALPEETFIDSGGYQAVLTLAADIVADLEDAEPGTDFPGLERLGLAMDILRLGMRSNVGIDYVCGNTGDTAEAPPVAPLAIRALEALSRAASGSCHSSGSGVSFQEVAIATLPSAVRFVGALLHLTPIARFMSLAHVVHALRAALQCRPLSLPLTAAFRDLVRRERSRHWFSQGKEAAQLRGEFYRSLDGENVLNELALAATERVEELMESLQKKRGEGGQSYVACKSRGMKDVAVESLEEAVVIGNYYDNVEAAVVAVYGKTSRVEEMAELQELRSSLRPTAPAGALETMRRHLERCFPLRASTQE